MEIVPIFASLNPGLLAASFPEHDEDEFDRIFDQWNDPMFLEEFFENNKADLQSGFFGDVTVEDAVLMTRSFAKNLERKIRKCLKENDEKSEFTLNNLFQPLKKDEELKELAKNKAYGDGLKSWLRVYAIRVNNKYFVVTGGAIKLTKAMQDRDHTNKELQKLTRVRDFLFEQGMIGEEAYLELYL